MVIRLSIYGMLAIGLLTLLAVVHWTRLDRVAWYAWNIAFQQKTERENAMHLGGYRVDIEGRVLEGLVEDVSGLAYNPERNTLFTVLNEEALIAELSLEGVVLRKIRVDGAQDLEGLTHVADNRYVLVEEQRQILWLVNIDDETNTIRLDHAPHLTLAIDANTNTGFEGLYFHREGKRLLAVKERDPMRVLTITGFVEQKPGEILDVVISDARPPNSPELFVWDLSSVAFHETTGHLLLLSDASKLMVEYDTDGKPVGMLPLWRGFNGLHANVPQPEGLDIDSDGRIYIVSEPNLFYRFSRR